MTLMWSDPSVSDKAEAENTKCSVCSQSCPTFSGNYERIKLRSESKTARILFLTLLFLSFFCDSSHIDVP